MSKWYYTLVLLGVLLFFGLHPFLALSRPVKANLMVIEGWIPDRALNYAIKLFKDKQYRWIVTNGGKIIPPRTATPDATYAEQAKKMLILNGISPQKVFAVKTRRINGSKTYSAARATVAWVTKYKAGINAINVLSLDAHARKSYVLYKKAAGDKLNVGVISIPPVAYQSDCWFFSLYGIRFVLKNLVGYLYALFL